MRRHQMGSIKKSTELDNPGHATSCVTDLPPLVQQKKNEKKIFTEDLEGDKCVHARNVTHEDGTTRLWRTTYGVIWVGKCVPNGNSFLCKVRSIRKSHKDEYCEVKK